MRASGCASGTVYTATITVSSSETLYAVAGGTGYADSSIASAAYTINGTASAPTFSPGAGSYTGTQHVTLATSSSGAVICYNTSGAPSTNGASGCTSGNLYSAPVAVPIGETLYAIAGGTGYTDSSIASAAYTINGTASAPTFSPGAGSYTGTQHVTLATSSSGAVICYNTSGAPATNGASGCTSGTLYSAPVAVPIGETLYAVAGGTGYADSSIASAAYTINSPASAPTFSPGGGSYTGTQHITLATSSSGAVICYNTTGAPSTNGAGGCTSGTVYTAPVTVSSGETLYAVAGGTGYADSSIASATYSITLSGSPGTVLLGGRTIVAGKTIVL